VQRATRRTTAHNPRSLPGSSCAIFSEGVVLALLVESGERVWENDC